MADFLTIDGGTTNTRISLVTNGAVQDTLKIAAGARANIAEPTLLQDSIRDGIRKLLDRNQRKESDITKILASGMITCEYGLCNLPHIIAPAGIAELHENMHEVCLPEISPIPFVFIRGVKLAGNRLEDVDMMRGEETELLGMGDLEEGMYVLPGSHSKLIQVDKNGKISSFRTELTGEMIAALAEHTILNGSLDLQTSKLVLENLWDGYCYCDAHGINEALFKVRILKNLFGAAADAVYSFFLGVVLHDEIKSVLACKAPRIVIGGKRQLREPMAYLLQKCTDAEVISLPEEQVGNLPALGAVKIYTYGE